MSETKTLDQTAFLTKLAEALKGKKGQTQFADEIAAEYGMTADAVKARYQSLRQKYKKAIEDEGKAGKVDSVKRLEAAMTALSFPDGRENRKSNYLEDSMRMLEEAGLLPKTE